MSLTSRVLGIPGLECERVDWNTKIDVWAKPNKRPSCLYCGCRHLRIKATEKRTVKNSRQGNRVVMLHLEAPKYHCQAFGRYFCHRFTGIRPRFRASEGHKGFAQQHYFPKRLTKAASPLNRLSALLPPRTKASVPWSLLAVVSAARMPTRSLQGRTRGAH